MNKQATWPLVVVLALMVASAAILLRFQEVRRLGNPGVRVVRGELRDTAGTVVASNMVYLPETVLSMTSTQLPISQLELGWLPPDTTYGRRRYLGTNGFYADVSVVLTGTDRTSIHQPQYCLTAQGFFIDRSDRLTIPINRPVPYDLEVLRLTSTYTERLPDRAANTWRGIFVYWFVADRQMTSSHGTRMWWLARELLLTGVLQRWAYISFFTVCRPGGEEAAYAQLEQMIKAAVPDLQLVPSAAQDRGTSGRKD